MSDADRFTRLYRDHRADLERFVRRRLPPAQVEDVVAEAFLVAWRRLDEAPPEVRPWLFGIARNVMLVSTRTHGRWRALHVRLAAQPEPAGLELAADVASRTDIIRAWSKLADDGRDDVPGVLAQATDGDASFVLVAVPSSREWAVTHLFFAIAGKRRHMNLTSLVSTLNPEVTEVGCAYEHSHRGPRYHYAVIRRSAVAEIRCRVDDGAWRSVTRGVDGWFVTISTAQAPDSALQLEEIVQGTWHPLP